MIAVDLIKSFSIPVEGVGIKHGEFPNPDETCSGPWVIPPLCLQLVYQKREALVGIDLTPCDIRDSFLMCHRKDHISVVPVRESAHLLVDRVVPSSLLPDIGRIDHRHLHLFAADCVHLLADDVLYLLGSFESQWKQGEYSRSHLPYISCSQQILISFGIGSVRCLPESS